MTYQFTKTTTVPNTPKKKCIRDSDITAEDYTMSGL